MTVSAPVSISAVATLAKLATLALPLPQGASPSARAPDLVDLGSSEPLHNLFDLASAGLRQLTMLLPTLDRMVRPDSPSPLPLPVGHLARALGDAAHWIDAGWTGVLAAEARPSDATPEALAAWHRAAHRVLDDTDGLLTQAGRRFEPPPLAPEPVIPQQALDPEQLWAMAQIANAQKQVGVTRLNLAQEATATPRAAMSIGRRFSVDHGGSIALLAAVLSLLVYGVAAETWSLLAGAAVAIVAIGGAFVRSWRLSRANLRIELRR